MEMSKNNNYIFFDRDGTLNIDDGYTHDPADLVLVDGVLNFMRRHSANFNYIVVTNQGGIAKEKFDTADMHKFNNLLIEMLLSNEINIEEIFFCPHHPEGNLKSLAIECDCRKPKPGLFKMAAEKFEINLPGSLVIGDKFTDILAGSAFGLSRGFLVSDSISERRKVLELNKKIKTDFKTVACFNEIKLEEEYNDE